MMNKTNLLLVLFIMLLFESIIGFADDQTDEKLINDFIKSRGYTSTIVFDASNIKQFWVDNSVISKDGLIQIFGKPNNQLIESGPMRIQLANVNETMDCKIDVLTKDNETKFSIINILNGKNKTLSTSSPEQDFIDYHIISSTFHLEDISNNIFFVAFSSNKNIAIKKIVLSFSKNQNSSFLVSPGVIEVSTNDVIPQNDTFIDNDRFVVEGKNSQIWFKKKILVESNEIKTSVKIKNIGDKRTWIYFGFIPYTQKGDSLRRRNYPYKEDSKTLEVVSVNAEKGEIIVDTYPQWEKSCHVALNAKDDFSDIPNLSLLPNTILDVEKLENAQGKIKMNPFDKSALKVGDKIRVHGPPSGYMYPCNKVLNPGEEVILESNTKKGNKDLLYSSQVFSQGIYCVRPIVFSYTDRDNEKNKIQISDYSISY